MFEQTTAYLDVELRNKFGTPEDPESVSYRVDCMSTGRNVRSDTSIPAASKLVITLNTNDNSMVYGSHNEEVHRVTITAVYGPGDKLVSQFDYRVNRAKFAP